MHHYTMSIYTYIYIYIYFIVAHLRVSGVAVCTCMITNWKAILKDF
jgi:hypothetical protein